MSILISHSVVRRRRGFVGITFSLGTWFKLCLVVVLLLMLAFWAGEVDATARHLSFGDWSWLFRW